MTNDEYIFQISKSCVEEEFRERYGRIPTDDEWQSIKNGLEWGLLTDIDTVFSAAFSQAIESSANTINTDSC